MGRKGILLASANPSLEDHLDQLEQEVEDIYTTLSVPGLASKVELYEETRMKLSRLFRRFNNRYAGKIHLLHYCGHSDEEKIYLEKPASDEHAMDVLDFAAFLKLQPDIEVVFLNSCSSYVLGEHLLDQSNIQAVIETTREVGDREAAAFALTFYTILATGKTIKGAFEEAQIMQAENYPGNYQKRDISRGMKIDLEDGPGWQLSIREGGDKWQLFPGTVQSRLESLPDDTIKVLTFFGEEDQAYYDALRASFGDENQVFFYHFHEVSSEVKGRTDQLSCLQLADVYVFILSPALIEFWKNFTGDDRWQSLLPKPAALIAGRGDTEQHASFLMEHANLVKKSMITVPKAGFTLEEIVQLRGRNLEKLVNQFCRQELETLLFTDENKLEDFLINLNFNHQKQQYGDAQFSAHKRLFLVLLEGTTRCAQEVLIKALSRLPDTYLDLQETEITHLSLRSCFPNGGVTLENLMEEVKRTLLPPPYNLDLEGLLEVIRKRLLNEDMVFILNDVDLSLYPDLPGILRDIWNQIVHFAGSWTAIPTHRFFFFILNKSETTDFPKGIFKALPAASPCHSFVLDRIGCLNESEFNLWYGNGSGLFQPYSSFHGLRNRREEIVEKKYMAFVISEICRILKRPAVSENVLTI